MRIVCAECMGPVAARTLTEYDCPEHGRDTPTTALPDLDPAHTLAVVEALTSLANVARALSDRMDAIEATLDAVVDQIADRAIAAA